MSIPFTWQLGEAKKIAMTHNGKIIAGGPAVKLMPIEWADTPDFVLFDVLSMHNPCATFTSRGCPRKCQFCAVPQIEGDFIELSEWKPNPLVCDNNILASSKKHFEDVIDKLRTFPYVDFNQGLDARLFTRWHANQLSRLSGIKVRFAFDSVKNERVLMSAIGIARNAGLKDFGVYVLIGFNDTQDDAIYRLEKIRQLGIRPNPMRYQPLDCAVKNSYVAKGWTEHELKRVTRYYSRLRFLEHIPFEDYEYGTEETAMFNLPPQAGR